MSATPGIVKLKVKVQQVVNFPFDVVYLVPQTHKSLLPRMFPYSLCLPLNAELLKRLQNLSVDDIFTVSMTSRQKDPRTIHPTVGDVIEDAALKNSFMVVPVLARTHKTTRSKRRNDRNPAYLLANSHRKGVHETKKGKRTTVEPLKRNKDLLVFFNDFAVMFTPRGAIRPICKMCPCHLEHIQGKCSLGEQKCYESLVLQPQKENPREQLQDN